MIFDGLVFFEPHAFLVGTMTASAVAASAAAVAAADDSPSLIRSHPFPFLFT